MGTRGSSGARGPGREGVPGRATVVVSIRRGLFSPVWGAGGPSSTGVELIKPSGDTVRTQLPTLNKIVNQAIAVGDKVLVFSSSPTLKYLSQLMDRAQMKYSTLWRIGRG
ncbi:hypothetical protein N7530_007513 [Penicillium desertorum]|uniref:Uncharacterized protein n=1 Tax=Penicillium desertorum TaxID=1303715 RepID=A0A9W9WMI3_9EURO|nr:hypothetical protein N7530_007513 [Penicillium desertorum]